MKKNYFEQMSECFLIAEIGVNHNGDMGLAIKMIDAAKSAGANAVKFQTFTAESLVTRSTPKVKYQETTTNPEETHYEMIKNLEFKKENHKQIKKYCDEIGIMFLSTPYDVKSAIFLNEEINVEMFKTASADIIDYPLHRYIASTGKPSIIPIGMATLGEVEDVVEIYNDINNRNYILLHCVSNYPCSDESLNMRVLQTISQAFQIPIGYSDHSNGNIAAVISVTQGAKVIEKHFTIDKMLPGPDQLASSTPEEFDELVRAVRRAEIMMGSPIKRCQSEEKQMAKVSRKSIVINSDMTIGQTIETKDLVMKRPGTGLPSKYLDFFVGKKVNKFIKKDSLISFLDVT